MANEAVVDREIEQVQAEYERQVRMAVALAQAQLSTQAAPGLPRAAGLKGVPDFPPDPDWFKVMGKYVVEAINHLPDTTSLVGGVVKIATTAYGRDLIARLVKAIGEKKDDEKLWKEFIDQLVIGPRYGSLLLGVVSEAHAGIGVVGSTGVAVPLKPGSRVKWFSGLEKAVGISIGAGTGLVIGERLETPEHLTGQFYGGHIGVDIVASMSSSLYFDTSADLTYKGFSAFVGVGAGFTVSVLSGWELVTSD